MRVYVVDASIILKWTLPRNISPLQEQALAIRDELIDGKIIALVPSLWRYEVGNTLGRLVPGSASELIVHCSDIGLQEAKESIRRDQEALDLMRRWKVSFYDASYHALAIINDIDFITADEKYIKKIENQGNAILLKDWL